MNKGKKEGLSPGPDSLTRDTQSAGKQESAAGECR